MDIQRFDDNTNTFCLGSGFIGVLEDHLGKAAQRQDALPAGKPGQFSTSATNVAPLPRAQCVNQSVEHYAAGSGALQTSTFIPWLFFRNQIRPPGQALRLFPAKGYPIHCYYIRLFPADCLTTRFGREIFIQIGYLKDGLLLHQWVSFVDGRR